MRTPNLKNFANMNDSEKMKVFNYFMAGRFCDDVNVMLEINHEVVDKAGKLLRKDGWIK